MDTVPPSHPAAGASADAGMRAPKSSVIEGAIDRVTEVAGDVLDQAKSKGGSLATAASGTAKDLLAQKIAAGGQWIGHLAESTRCAADNLESNAPQLAGFVRQAGDSIESFSSELQTRSVDEMVQGAADFARRRPEIVFGVSALLGFLAFRVLTSSAADRRQA